MASFFNRFTSVLRPSIVRIMNHTEFRRYQKTDSILTWSMLPCFFLLCYNWHWPINVLQLPSDYVVARVRSVACGKKKKHQLSEDMAGYSEKDIDTEEELQWKPPSEAELKVIQARRDRSDRISKIMGSYLLKGYKMLASECSKCGVPMPL